MSTVVFTPLPESTDERGVSFTLADDVLAPCVETGRIRIVGRPDWLMSPKDRDTTALRWPGAVGRARRRHDRGHRSGGREPARRRQARPHCSGRARAALRGAVPGGESRGRSSAHHRTPECRSAKPAAGRPAQFVTLDESLAEVFGTTLDGLSGTAGLALSLADWANQGVISGFGLAGLAAGLVGAGHGALRWLGYAKAGPKRQKWPFLYTFGRGPNRREYEKVAQALDRLSA